LAAAGLWRVDPANAAAQAPPAGAAVERASLDPDDLLLFSLSLEDISLSDGLAAYGGPEDPLVPVGEIVRLLEADVDVFPAEGRIAGRLGAARSPLVVDLANGVARSGARDAPMAAGDAVASPTEIYLRTSLLKQLFDMDVEVSSDELALRLKPREPFPVQTRLARLASRPSGDPGEVDLPALQVRQPYQVFSPPGLDALVEVGTGSDLGGSVVRYDLRFAGDLLWTNLQGFLGSDQDGRVSNARLLLQRRSLEGGLLGRLKVREITVGDTFTPNLAIGAGSSGGRGFSISTAPLQQASIFNRVDFRGDLPSGFDAELYVNEVLRGGTSQAVNGRFEFLDVPLAPGVNVVRLVTYGPRGERSEEVRIVNLGAGLLRPGEARAALGVVEQGRAVLEPRGRPLLPATGGPLTAQTGLRAVASIEFGLTELVTLTGGAALRPLPGNDVQALYTAGARASLLGFAAQLDVAADEDGGQAVSLGFAGRLGRLSSSLRHAEYRGGFADEANPRTNFDLELRRRTEVSLDSSVALRGAIIPVSLRAERNDYAAGASELIATARGSSSLGGVLLSAGVEYERRAGRSVGASERLRGTFAASTFGGGAWQVRASLDYDILPELEPSALTLTVDRRITDVWTVRFGLGQPLDGRSSSNVRVSSNLATGHGDFGLAGEYDNTKGDWRVAAQWNFGLGYDPSRSRYSLVRSGPGSGGSVLFNAFIDANGDGVRQAAEAAAPNVAVGGAGRAGGATDADGRLLLMGLGAGPTAIMDVNLEGLENASVASPPTRLALRPRPGSIARVDYPLRPTGGVAVKVELLRDDGGRAPLASVRLQLVSDGGEIVEGATEFDGSAIFDAAPVGAYRLQLDPGQASKLRMRLLQQPKVTIPGDGTFAPSVTVQVRFDPPPEDATVAKAGAQ
jgi:hypothetical protein